MPLSEFYSAVAQLSFTLFGVWFVVVELASDDLLAKPALRRVTFHVCLGFLVPGVVSLASMLAAESLIMWRVAFSLGGLAGALGTARLAMSADARGGPVPLPLWWVSVAVYALFMVVALFRPALDMAGTAIAPLTQEGILITTQLLLGAAAAWRVFTMPRTADAT